MPGVSNHRVRYTACVAFLAFGAAIVVLGQANSPQGSLAQPQPKDTYLTRADNRPPDANDVMKMREQQNKRKNFDAANLERKRQLGEDSALLLKLAEELDTEVARVSTDTLSPTEIQKIEDIERLAHNVQQKMKLTVGAS
jgi:hypothetical protein